MSNIEDRGAAALDKLTSEKKTRRKKGLRLVKTGGEEFGPDGRRIIKHRPGELPKVLNQLGLSLSESCENLFVYAERLVHLYVSEETVADGLYRPPGALVVHPVNKSHLTELATAVARHERFDARAQEDLAFNCPTSIAEAYLARGHWPELRPMAGFIEAPTITLDGRLIQDAGYDAGTGLYMAGVPLDWSAPPANPTRADAEAARDVLLDLMKGFPFVADADRAAVVAGIITALIRRLLPAAPLVAITAPTPGTGKTLIAETFAVIATGRRASVLALGHDDAETEKRLDGMLLSGDTVIALDNIERPLKSERLCQMTTQQFVRVRPLGVSVMPTLPTHVFLVATGNNLSILGDLKRRVVLIRMDSGKERPEQRTFSCDHLGDVFARRGELIRAALTLPLAYLAAGAPAIKGMHPIGGFEQWDRLVRRPLVWLGLPDPMGASESLREQDPDLEGMRLLLGSWIDAFGNVPKTASDLLKAGLEYRPHSETYAHPNLRDALQMICFEKPTTRKFSNWLRAHRDRIVDGMQVKEVGRDGHAKVPLWTVSNADKADKADTFPTR